MIEIILKENLNQEEIVHIKSLCSNSVIIKFNKDTTISKKREG